MRGKMTEYYNSIAPKFRSRKAYINAMDKITESKLKRNDVEIDNARIDSFLNSDAYSYENFVKAFVSYKDNSHPGKYLLVGECLKIGRWNLPAYQNTWLRIFIDTQIQFYHYEAIRASGEQLHSSISVPVTFGDVTAMMAIFGNCDLFENAAKFCLDVFDRKLVGGDVTYLTQLFILRLSEFFLGISPRNWDDEKKWAVDPRQEEPLFQSLWNHWDDEDTTQLEPLLVQLLNRHTFEASRKNKYGDHDFEGHSEQFPMELFFLYRLREWRGLKNPTIKHRLTEPPFDVLTEPLQELVFDHQTIAFVKKVREVFPDFDDVVNAVKIRDWRMLL